jgi:hypothetical protein
MIKGTWCAAMAIWSCCLVAQLSGNAIAQTKIPVDLELVMATDVSWSIDDAEAQLQRQGVADAFRDPEIIRAIRSGFLRSIAVAYIDYSSADFNRVVIDWRVIRGKADAEKFAADLLAADLTSGRRTSISDAVEQAAAMIDGNNIEGTRRVIDVSGDGPNNWGNLVDDVRDAVIRKRITINGLPIMNPADAFNSRYYLPDLDLYYRGCVIGGPGAFMIVANSFKDYARAVRRKLVLEIAGAVPRDTAPPRALFLRAANATSARPSPSGYTYPKGCDIGERMRGFIEEEF